MLVVSLNIQLSCCKDSLDKDETETLGRFRVFSLGAKGRGRRDITLSRSEIRGHATQPIQTNFLLRIISQRLRNMDSLGGKLALFYVLTKELSNCLNSSTILMLRGHRNFRNMLLFFQYLLNKKHENSVLIKTRL